MSDDPTYPKLKEILVAKRDDLLRMPSVNAICISYKRVNEKWTKELGITFHVSKKKKESELSAEEVLPKQLQGFPTDVIELEVVEPKGFQMKDDGLEDAQLVTTDSEVSKNVSTLRGGDSIGPRTGQTTGTLGYFFKDSKNQRGVITSAHVVPKKGNIMISPSVAHGGNPNTDVIGKNTIKVITQHTDGAFVQLDDQTTSITYALKDGTTVPGYASASLNDNVYYWGAESGKVNGVVTGLNWSGTFPSGYKFVDQIQIKSTGQGGDSGSLLVRASDNKALGVLMATLRDPSTGVIDGTVHNPINYFQSDLGITLV